MTQKRVSFRDPDTGRRKRGRLLQFLSVPFGRIVALVEVDDGSIVQVRPGNLRILKGRRR